MDPLGETDPLYETDPLGETDPLWRNGSAVSLIHYTYSMKKMENWLTTLFYGHHRLSLSVFLGFDLVFSREFINLAHQ